MALPDRSPLLLNIIFQRPPKEGLKSMPFSRICLCNQPEKWYVCFISNQEFSVFTKREEYYPHVLIGKIAATLYNDEESHSEQFLFFSELLFLSALNLILHLWIIPEKYTEIRINIEVYDIWHRKIPHKSAGLCLQSERPSVWRPRFVI